MVRSDKVHVVGLILSCVHLRKPFSNVRLFRHTTVRHDLFCSVPAEVFVQDTGEKVSNRTPEEV